MSNKFFFVFKMHSLNFNEDFHKDRDTVSMVQNGNLKYDEEYADFEDMEFDHPFDELFENTRTRKDTNIKPSPLETTLNEMGEGNRLVQRPFKNQNRAITKLIPNFSRERKNQVEAKHPSEMNFAGTINRMPAKEGFMVKKDGTVIVVSVVGLIIAIAIFYGVFMYFREKKPTMQGGNLDDDLEKDSDW